MLRRDPEPDTRNLRISPTLNDHVSLHNYQMNKKYILNEKTNALMYKPQIAAANITPNFYFLISF